MVWCASRFSGLVVVPFASATSRSAVIEGGRHEAALLLAGREEYSLAQTDAMLLTDRASHTDAIANDRSSASLPSLAPRQDGRRAFSLAFTLLCVLYHDGAAGVRRCLQATYGEGLEGLPLSSVSWERGDGAEEGRRKKGGEVEEEEEQGGSEEGGDDQDEESEDNDDDDDDEEEDHEEEESVWAGRRRQAVVVGLVGEPNVGKSSLLNTLLGRKRVSVSATPGRTKHLQTHYYSRSVVLCDCPGVVFPRLGVERPLQVGRQRWAEAEGRTAPPQLRLSCYPYPLLPACLSASGPTYHFPCLQAMTLPRMLVCLRC